MLHFQKNENVFVSLKVNDLIFVSIYVIFLYFFLCLGFGGLGVSIGGPGTAEINCEDNGDGTCRVTYKPTAPGIYDLHVKYADQEIPGKTLIKILSKPLCLPIINCFCQ